ncbi:C6 zinc finger domain protein [Aspergillus bombycis]|uniref:C6 zinc finger domain protein n=1 Tax=Aspergillus bombycis TaxID=109264 RepID=A0A1F7ZX16_9EURO|nr:C6 zinc finger domain protein [Aspergillus bombycis]OGM43799.1 C6 zinc finger domain protein [Aspergillus bombycis]
MCACDNLEKRRFMDKTRQRNFASKRSRTGCRTCRARHVKCDEAPGACGNCTSSGRSCDGYDLQRLPPPARSSRKKTPWSRLLPEVGGGIRWITNTDERRCFSYFQYYTVPTLSGFFNSVLWEKLVLQMSYAEPAVYHAAVALSAIHQDVEMHGMPLPGQELELYNTWHRFTMEQAGRSFAILNERHFSQDPRLREVMLLCCLLFVLMELLRGRYDDAFQHLEGGLRILNELKAQRQLVSWAPHESPVEEALVAAFAQLDIQAASFKVGGPILRIEDELDVSATEDYLLFSNVREARRAIEPLLSRAFGFLMDCWSKPDKEIICHYKGLQQEQQKLFSELNHFSSQFDAFYNYSYTRLGRKDQRGADMINILRHTTSLSIRTSLIRDEVLLSQYQPEYKANLALVEAVMYKFRERPNYTLDMGVVPPLYIISIGCPDYSLRWRAIELLRSWPHREGVFDSNWAAFIAEEHIKTELRLQGFHGIDGLSASARDSGSPTSSVASKEDSKTEGKLEKGRWSTLGQEEYSIEQGLEKTKCMEDWPCVQSLMAARRRCTL